MAISHNAIFSQIKYLINENVNHIAMLVDHVAEIAVVKQTQPMSQSDLLLDFLLRENRTIT